MTGQILSLPDENPEIEHKYLRKIFKYIRKCKKRVADMNIKDPMPFAKVVEIVIIHNED